MHTRILASCEDDWSNLHQNYTLRKNVIGFSEYDEDFYGLVTHMCDLDKDFSKLENRDLTTVGSKGIMLSGGQKQRVVSLNPNLKIFLEGIKN